MLPLGPARRAVACLLVLSTCPLAASSAAASPGSPRTAAVSLGDSYISGEAGRWNGNSPNNAGDRDATDRACVPGPLPGSCASYNQAKVYVGGSDRNPVDGSDGGCHRSDVAEILSATIAVDERVNLSCSGAVTKNIRRAAQGGEGQRGERPQSDQLLDVARAKDVRLVVLSIGGNDLGFASIVSDCFTRYVSRQGACRPVQEPKLRAQAPAVQSAVAGAIDEVRAAMRQAGYTADDFRLVVQTYPSVIAAAADTRFAEADPQRAAAGCPFYDEDLTWARTSAAPFIGSVVKAAAASRGAEVLDLVDAFTGHEICAKASQAASPVLRPAPFASAEWGRAVSASSISQGEVQELFHPNAFGQRALGACVTQVAASAPGSFACAGTPGRDASGMRVTRTSATGTTVGGREVVNGPGASTTPRPGSSAGSSAGPPAPALKRLRLSIRPRPSRRRAFRCFTVRVTRAGRPVARVRVRLATRRETTARTGRVVLCARRAGARRVTITATRRGYVTARRTVRVR